MVYPGTLRRLGIVVKIDGVMYYRTAEVCRIVGISRNTLFRWMREGKFGNREYRDWRGWRLFTRDQMDGVREQTSQVSTINRYK